MLDTVCKILFVYLYELRIIYEFVYPVRLRILSIYLSIIDLNSENINTLGCEIDYYCLQLILHSFEEYVGIMILL